MRERRASSLRRGRWWTSADDGCIWCASAGMIRWSRRSSSMPSGWGNALSSSKARERLATRTRVCSYDRLGRGWSDAAPGVTTIGGTASDLGVLQDRAKLSLPVVLVGSSIGGLTAEMFARTLSGTRRRHRLRGCGQQSDRPASWRSGPWTITALACTAGTLARFGVIRLLDPVRAWQRFGRRATFGGDHLRRAALDRDLRDGARPVRDMQREFEQAPPLPPELPVTALSASSARQLMPPFAERFIDASQMRDELEDSHRALAKRVARHVEEGARQHASHRRQSAGCRRRRGVRHARWTS